MRSLRFHALLIIALASLCGVTARGNGPLSGMRRKFRASPGLEGLVDFVIDLTPEDDMEIKDADDEDEEEEEAKKPRLCIAPPCAGINVPAVPLSAAPVPWLYRLMAPGMKMPHYA